MWAEQQVESLMDLPNISARTLEVAKGFPAAVKQRDAARASAVISQRRAADRAVITTTSEKVKAGHARLQEIKAELESGDLSALDAVSETEQIVVKIREAQRRHDALTSSAARNDEIEQDPSAYYEAIYEKYPALADRRYTLADYLAERGLSR